MARPNKHRGEIAVKLGRKDYVLRPDHEAMYAIDEEAPDGILALARMAWERKSVPAKHVARIIYEGIHAQQRATNDPMLRVSLDKVRELVFAEGVANVQQSAVAFLAACITGGAEPDEGNAEAAEKR